MSYCLSEIKNNRTVIALTGISIILLLSAIVLTILAIQESQINCRTYNRTELIATSYYAQQTDCYGLPWRAFIVAEYDAFDRNLTIKHYIQTFSRIGNNEICGTNKVDALQNASTVWPITSHKESYYLIDDPNVLIGVVTHGELYTVFAVICAMMTISIFIFTALHIYSRRPQVRYTQLQFAESIN